MNVYIASKLENYAAAQEYARVLETYRIRVTSRWHRETPRPDAALTDAEREDVAHACYTDMARAYAMLVLPHPGMRGSLVELGVAIGEGMPVVVAGEPRDLTLMALHHNVRFIRRGPTAVAEDLVRIGKVRGWV